MPTRQEILSGLTLLANEYMAIAIIWHILIFILIAGLFAGWKPRNNLMILILTSPLLSVSVCASLLGNYFNATIFALLVIMSIYATLRSRNELIKGNRSWPDIIGLLLVIYGLSYPEFLIANSFLEYAYAAPTGLIPCPTLAVLTGFALLYRGFGSGPWAMTLAISGMFYGLFGVFYLNVYLDWILLAGASILLLNTFSVTKRSPSFDHP
jgi:hypothetical protein